MRNIMLAPQGAAPSTQERISFFQVEVLDAYNSRVGFINTDAMALVLQEFGFAVMDAQKKEDLTFGQAIYMMRTGKVVRRIKWSYAIGLKDNVPFLIAGRENPKHGLELTWEDMLAKDWLVHE